LIARQWTCDPLHFFQILCILIIGVDIICIQENKCCNNKYSNGIVNIIYYEICNYLSLNNYLSTMNSASFIFLRKYNVETTFVTIIQKLLGASCYFFCSNNVLISRDIQKLQHCSNFVGFLHKNSVNQVKNDYLTHVYQYWTLCLSHKSFFSEFVHLHNRAVTRSRKSKSKKLSDSQCQCCDSRHLYPHIIHFSPLRYLDPSNKESNNV